MDEQIIDEAVQGSMLPYYVYELRDPTDKDRVFYVGKGQGRRIEDHNENEGGEKSKKISEIQRQNHEVKRVVIGRYETEAEAFAVEATLIKWVYGFDSLTNRVHGHRAQTIRSIKQINEELEAIDIPRTLGGGAYTQAQREQIQANGVVEKLESIRQSLADDFPNYKISAPDTSRPQDPCLHIDNFLPKDCSPKILLNVKLGLAGQRVSLLYLPSNTSDVDKFKAMDCECFKVCNKKSKAPYSRIRNEHTNNNGYIYHEDHSTIAKAIKSSIEELVKIHGNHL